MENLSYLRTLLGKDTIEAYSKVLLLTPDKKESYEKYYPEKVKAFETVTKCLNQMDVWGTNNWWLSTDQRKLAFYQIMSDELIIPFNRFHSSLESLIGRTIPEMVTRYQPWTLRQEAKEAFNNLH